MDDSNKTMVLKTYPEATCFKTKLYWPGQGGHEAWIVTRSPHWSGVDGHGEDEERAWEDAVKRIKRRMLKWKPH